MNTDVSTLIAGMPAALVIAALASLALLALLGGHALGARRSRRSRRSLQRTLSERELELLESRADAARLGRALTGFPRRERVLRLSLERLREARASDRRRSVEVTRLRLALAESKALNRRVVRLAARAAARVRELESNPGATGTIVTRAVKSHGNGETVTMIDPETSEARSNGAAARAPHRERARLARLAPSSEARCPAGANGTGEPAIVDGPAADDEARFAEHGIRRPEQLAGLTGNELQGSIGAPTVDA